MERKRLCSSTSSVMVVFSNNDLLIEILLLFPPKALIGFKLVNKQWNSVISGELFRRLHTVSHRHRPKPLPCFLIRSIFRQYYYFNPVAKTFVEYFFPFLYTCIIQSCNGLLLLECRSTRFGRKEYYVCNPTTNRYKEIFLNYDRRDITIAGICLVFDPSISADYKIVCIWKIPSLSQFKIEVHHYRGSQSPKTLGEPFHGSRYATFSQGIYWNNGIYWIRPSSSSHVLDLDSGTMGTPPSVRIPWRRTGERNKNYVMESNGHMHCVALFSRRDALSMLVLELNGKKSGWLEKYYAIIDPFNAGTHSMNGREQVIVLGIIRGDREEDSAVLLHVPTKIICYRFCDGSCEVVVDLIAPKDIYENYPNNKLLFDRGDACQFIESLVPV